MCPVQIVSAETTMEKMYSMNGGLSRKGNMSNSKKENMFHSVFNALNILWEQFSKVPASFIASINYPLSVTVVNNGGIISHDFFKNLTSKREPLDTDNLYIHDAQRKESLNIVESIHSDIFDKKNSYISRIFNENTKDSLNFSYEYMNCNNRDEEKSDIKDMCMGSDCNYLVPVKNSKKVGEGLMEYTCPDITIQNRSTGKNDCYTEDTDDKSISNKEQFSECFNNSMSDKMIMRMETTFSTSDVKSLNSQSFQQVTVSNLFTSVLQRVFSGVTDRFYRAEVAESDMTMKRSFSPKQRRKLNAVAKGRGRGRGKSQLRRSGVSQTRHRKERTKHDIAADIENELKSWQEFDFYDMTESKESEDCFSLDEDTVDAIQYIIEESPVAYTFADIKPKSQKLKARKNVDKGVSRCPSAMRSIPECTEETFGLDHIENRYNVQRNTFRSRLMSESSIDSEDSYCIVFETSSEVTCKSDFEDSEESDMDETSEDEEETSRDEESVSPVQKVKFNLNPVVHIMVQWDYAYRAARKGPWEEMARDRDRFRGRINCIERVLNPILTVQHRTHIWQERFAITE